MGLSNFPSAAEGVLPVLVMNTVMSVAILKNLLRSVLQLMGAAAWISTNFEENPSFSSTSTTATEFFPPNNPSKKRTLRGIRITKFKYLCDKDKRSPIFALGGEKTPVECCVCLCKFGDEEEVSELSCKHFFHKNCLDKWFDNHHSTCPLCRSIH